ncbi:MAG TPA: substrate-binding domain-containing protein [Candidatus Binataceae bacterium]|nr:substrate-binding domain-containing protein [Candidatus Binataceae bacterium]
MANSGDHLRKTRIACSITQSELARRAGISRQALGAIESGIYLPSVTVALNLARELGVDVETLFGGDSSADCRSVAAHLPPTDSVRSTTSGGVILARVAGKVVAAPQIPSRLVLAPASGLLERTTNKRAAVATFRSDAEIESVLMLAGCDPSVTLLADWLARQRSPVRAFALSCSSGKAMRSLLENQAHAAGAHLKDGRSGEYNLAQFKQALGHRRAIVVNFARWELGLAAAAGNQLGLRGIASLARPQLRIVNREPGAGARAVLDEGLDELGIKPDQLEGYGHEVSGHLEVAAVIAEGRADAGITIRVAANAYGLDFIPIREERYDLAILERDLDSTTVKAMLEALNSRRFAREVSQLCAYDTDQMGTILAHIN